MSRRVGVEFEGVEQVHGVGEVGFGGEAVDEG